MHDYDRTTLETNGFDYESAYDMDDEYGYEYDDEYDDYEDDEYNYEYDDEYDDEYDYDDEMDYDGGVSSPLTEEEEAELAYELLSVQDEGELDEFLGKLIGRVKRKVRKYVPKSVRSLARRGLKRLAPIAGRTAGTFFGGPVGGRLGGRLGKYASKFFELDLEGLSPEDQEFETAKQYVKFGSAAAKEAIKNAGKMSPEKATKLAFQKAARKHAPGLLKMKPSRHRGRGARGGRRQKSGTWYRRGNRVILQGV